VPRPDDGPGAIAWLIALISVVLPWAGIGLGLVGGWQLSQGDPAGWWMLLAGAALLIADVLIDFVWAHPTVSRSDQPELNRRAVQLVGRVLIVEEAIEGGRGKVRVGDTLWPAEGPDTPVGAEVRVTAARATVLLVERLHLDATRQSD
jgi:membrane protein implicated in regulation of membrane protease activity